MTDYLCSSSILQMQINHGEGYHWFLNWTALTAMEFSVNNSTVVWMTSFEENMFADHGSENVHPRQGHRCPKWEHECPLTCIPRQVFDHKGVINFKAILDGHFWPLTWLFQLYITVKFQLQLTMTIQKLSGSWEFTIKKNSHILT